MMQTATRYNNFLFRDIHPYVRIGTASDRYAGWIGQIYSEGRYRGGNIDIIFRNFETQNEFLILNMMSIQANNLHFKHVIRIAIYRYY